MTATVLAELAATKENFATVKDYIAFYRRFVEFVACDGMHGTIVSRNENHYYFYQYNADGGTRLAGLLIPGLFILVTMNHSLRIDSWM